MVRYGQLLSRLNGMLETAGDLGIGIDDLVIVKTHYDRVFGLSTDVGGAGDLGIPTALGVFVGIEESCKHAFGAKSLDNITVLVQGVGSVGGRLVELLLEAGCRVKFSDINEGQIQHFRNVVGLPFVSAESVYDEEADVFAPCAIGGILNYETVPRLRTRVIAGAANNQLLDSTIGDLLHRREMVYAPDFVVNAGAIIYAYSIEDENLSPEEANARVRAIGETLKSVFEIAYQQDISTARSAFMLANERIERFS
jgi:leucine dehydrogenase